MQRRTLFIAWSKKFLFVLLLFTRLPCFRENAISSMENNVNLSHLLRETNLLCVNKSDKIAKYKCWTMLLGIFKGSHLLIKIFYNQLLSLVKCDLELHYSLNVICNFTYNKIISNIEKLEDRIVQFIFFSAFLSTIQLYVQQIIRSLFVPEPISRTRTLKIRRT